MKTSEDTLIENNVYDFFNVIDNKVYYTIGNRDFRPLVRANFDGTEREQVMLNVKKMEMIRGGWFYVTKGTGVNTVLVKIRADGKATRVLATSIKKIVRFDGNYIYYSDFNDNLHVVRIDGAGEKIVAKDVEKIFPAEDGLYYCRKELVNDNETDLSLYHMDKDGKNIRKIVFNVDRVQDDPISNTIYYSKFENIRYKVYKPGKENKAHYEFLNITKFYSMKKAESGKPAGAPEIFLTLGLPEHEKKKGCLAKFKKDYVYEEAPIPHSYKTRGMTDEEIMAEEEANAPAKTPSWLPVPSILTKKRASKPNLTAALIGGCIKGCSPKK